MVSRWTAGALLILAAGCMHPEIRSTLPGPPPAAQMAEFWVEPSDLASRDLFHGPGGAALAPDPGTRWAYVARKKGGYSRGWTVKDPAGVVWSAKHGPESMSEVTASRLVWALGFHQPPTYHLEKWTLFKDGKELPQDPARFRPDLPDMKKVGEWGWHQNPFVGTESYRGLLVMMAMLNNSDLKPPQNMIYELQREREGARRWYVVRDLGHSFGETAIESASRSNLELFEKHGFIHRVEDGRVDFHHHGLHEELFRDITIADVRWTCERLSRLSERQWEDAFRAGGYGPAMTRGFVKRMKEKIAEGLALR